MFLLLEIQFFLGLPLFLTPGEVLVEMLEDLSELIVFLLGFLKFKFHIGV